MSLEIRDEHQSLIDHLTELRNRLIFIFYGVAIGFCLAWNFGEPILNFLVAPIEPYIKNGLNIVSPIEKFMTHMKISLFGGFVLSSPWALYQVWRFIAPGLYENERKWGLFFVSLGSVLFFSGIAFVYYIVFPTAFKVLLFDMGYANLEEQIQLGEYLGFVVTTLLAFGAVFEMPVVLGFMAKMGLVNAAMLRKFRRYAIVLNAIIAAIITPPDIMSMLFMLAPMMLLYELSILIVGFITPAPAEPDAKT